MELKDNVSIIRELHVYLFLAYSHIRLISVPKMFLLLWNISYGTIVPVQMKDPSKFQHQGFGLLLMEEAEKIAKHEHSSTKLSVISGCCCVVVGWVVVVVVFKLTH